MAVAHETKAAPRPAAAPAPAAAPPPPLTYGAYLRVPELLDLQTRLSRPSAHDELLFIIVQQVQELWFKQALHEVRAVVDRLDQGALLESLPLIGRITQIFAVLSQEVGVLATMPPQSFLGFRGVLAASSGLESEQFRELELASGLDDPTWRKVIGAHLDLAAVQARWPRTLRAAFCAVLTAIDADPIAALVAIYRRPEAYPVLFLLAEAFSAYEIGFSEWRFQHLKLVERVIGDRATGTAGTAGGGYLGRTLSYRFFPELWTARDRLTGEATAAGR